MITNGKKDLVILEEISKEKEKTKTGDANKMRSLEA